MTEEEKKQKKLGYIRAWRLASPDKVRRYQRNWRTANPDKEAAIKARRPEEARAKDREYARLKRLANPELHRSREYGMVFWPGQTVADMTEAQGNSCAVCHRSFNDTRMVVDHCHKTDMVRSLLCNGCNTGVARIENHLEPAWREYVARHASVLPGQLRLPGF